MKLTPIKKQRIYQSILKKIVEAIDSGELSPGGKLPSERELADSLNVSRTAVREAMTVLESSGVIDIFPGKGVYIKNSKKDDLTQSIKNVLNSQDEGVDIIELLEVRQAIEVQAAALAATRRTEEDLKKIKLAYDNLELSVQKNSLAAEEDFLFHIALVEASYNKTLINIMKLFYEEFLEGIKSWREGDRKIPSDMKLSRDTEHLDVYFAILYQDEESAKEAMNRHFENTKLSYIKQIKPSLKNE